MRILFLWMICLIFSSSSPPGEMPGEKILLVQVNEYGLVTIGRDTLSVDQMARYIQERLFKSYMGTGQMHDRIRLEKTDGILPEPVEKVILEEIHSGQQRALRELCMQKYRDYYENLSPGKQASIHKRYPVLFQDRFE